MSGTVKRCKPNPLRVVVVTALRGRGPITNGARQKSNKGWNNPYHPWDWFIYLHEWLFLMVKYGKCSIPYMDGKGNKAYSKKKANAY